MAKFPSQNKMMYQTGALSNDLWTVPESGGTAGHLNVPKDLSLLNRRGYASTTRKGVPLIYRCRVNFWLQDEEGQGLPTAASGTGSGTLLDSDYQITLRMDGCQNNWVMRNAAVKYHAAREKMFRDAGVLKKHRGAYSHEIRYAFDSASDTWLVPIDGDGDAFTGGTWDISDLTVYPDGEFSLCLVGNGDDEETDAFQGNQLQIGHSYLVSRLNLQADTNLEAEEGPAKYSVLNTMLSGDSLASETGSDDVREEARNAQDNPPYEVLDVSDSGDVGHDITESVELGRIVTSTGSGAHGSMIVDIPFGIANVRATVYDQADTNVTPSCLFGVEVLKIYEMQG